MLTRLIVKKWTLLCLVLEVVVVFQTFLCASSTISHALVGLLSHSVSHRRTIIVHALLVSSPSSLSFRCSGFLIHLFALSYNVTMCKLSIDQQPHIFIPSQEIAVTQVTYLSILYNGIKLVAIETCQKGFKLVSKCRKLKRLEKVSK